MKKSSSNLSISFILASLFLLGLVACGGGSSSETPSTPINLWTWMSGSDVSNQRGVYGTKGTVDAANVPGARRDAVGWTDSSGNLWLFGGAGYDRNGISGSLNDLWKYDGANWTWVNGSNVRNQLGVYGSMVATDNVPGARSNATSWTDSSGNLWLFGGYGYDSAGTWSYLNDLWKYDGTTWMWVSGSNIVEQMGVYESLTPADNVPGARTSAVSWTDSSGNLWLFGGYGYDSVGTVGCLNDLWKFDGTNWTWVSGSNVRNQLGVYDSMVAADKVPGARTSAVSWTDSSGNLWLFGGIGYDSVAATTGYLNDLWKYDGTNWVWVSGSNVRNQIGVYGTQGVADAANVPGARTSAVSWADSSGNLWLFGGNGYDSVGTRSYLNDLWKYDGSDWAWVSGSDTIPNLMFGAPGVYGTKGTADAANVPSARRGSTSWMGSDGNLWLFGSETEVLHNDLWRYQP